MTPGAFVQLVFKVRQTSPFSEGSASNIPKAINKDTEAEADEKFLLNKNEMEDLPGYKPQWAHAPYWPTVRFLPFVKSLLTYRTTEPKSWLVVCGRRFQNAKSFCATIQIHRRTPLVFRRNHLPTGDLYYSNNTCSTDTRLPLLQNAVPGSSAGRNVHSPRFIHFRYLP